MDNIQKNILLNRIQDFANDILQLPLAEKVELLNEARIILHGDECAKSC